MRMPSGLSAFLRHRTRDLSPPLLFLPLLFPSASAVRGSYDSFKAGDAAPAAAAASEGDKKEEAKEEAKEAAKEEAAPAPVAAAE